jgi:hypothetical protein
MNEDNLKKMNEDDFKNFKENIVDFVKITIIGFETGLYKHLGKNTTDDYINLILY